jgi:hypothetical protein
VWRATNWQPEQLSATANKELGLYYSNYTGFEFVITKIGAFEPNEWEGYECLERSALFDLVRVTFAYEWRTKDRTHRRRDELKFHCLL